jgi:uncharacterized protein YkwD
MTLVTRKRIRLLLATGAGTLAIAAAGAPAASAAPQACKSASATPAVASAHSLKFATLCLLNNERSARHMTPLRLNRRLSRASRRHANDMVRRHYFSHDTPSGTDFVQRIQRTGYLRAAGSWLVGENIAWGSVNRSTPASIMDAWMHSPGHRANILNRRFREIGIGVTFGAPEGVDGPSATYATDFGTRR